MFEHFHADACATTHVSFPLQLSAHLSECVNAPSTCSFKRYGCVFQVSIQHLSFPVTDILPWESYYLNILTCKFWTCSLCHGTESPCCMGGEGHMQPTWVLAFRACGVLRLQVDTCAEKEVRTLAEQLHLKPARKWDRQHWPSWGGFYRDCYGTLASTWM